MSSTETQFKEGEVNNPKGRPEGTGRKISKMKRLSNRIEEMARTKALGIIQKSLDGEEVDKDQLSTAKWTVTTAQQLHKAVLQEEEMLRGGKPEAEEELIPDPDGDRKVVFSLVMGDKKE